MNKKIIATGDKSKTLLIPELNETYHSSNGALNEALHVFRDAGLNYFTNTKSLSVFEMGFGTGLNALVSLDYANTHAIKINYTTIENTPIDIALIDELAYTNLFTGTNLKSDYRKLHLEPWNNSVRINKNFEFEKILGKIQEYIPNDHQKFDLIFYDAFGPRVQPELWTDTIMQQMYKMLNEGGILITYCAQGQFKRNLKSAGFTVENLPGPIGKREITRGIK